MANITTIDQAQSREPYTGLLVFSVYLAKAETANGTHFFTFDEIKKEVSFFPNIKEATDYYWKLLLSYALDVDEKEGQSCIK